MAKPLRNQNPQRIKDLIKRIPVIGPTAARLAQLPVIASVRRLAFPGSVSYWEARYREGGTSGPGSYGRLAEFKAVTLNEFVRSRDIRSVLEPGLR